MKPSVCPYIGLEGDPDTHLAFPSIRNCCHRAHPIEPVSLDYQSSHCLCDIYINCGVITNSIITPLPEELKYFASFSKGKGVRLSVAVGLGVCLLVIFISVILWLSEGRAEHILPTLPSTRMNFPSPTIAPTMQPTSKVAIPNVFVSPIDTSTQSIISSPNYSPTSTSILTSVILKTPVANTPSSTTTFIPSATDSVCSPPVGWIIYIVQANDSLFSIGIRFGITVNDLQAGNCMGANVTIFTGQVLYVPNVPTYTLTVAPSTEPTLTKTPLPPLDTPTSTLIASPTLTYTPTEIPTPTVTLSPTFPPVSTNTLTPPPTEAAR